MSKICRTKKRARIWPDKLYKTTHGLLKLGNQNAAASCWLPTLRYLQKAEKDAGTGQSGKCNCGVSNGESIGGAGEVFGGGESRGGEGERTDSRWP